MVGQSLLTGAQGQSVRQMQEQSLGRTAWTVGWFYVAWFTLVLLAAHGSSEAAVVVACAFAALHVAVSKSRTEEVRALCLGLGFGAIWENFAVLVGALDFPHLGYRIGWAPAWIISLWALFASTLRVAPTWIRQQRIAAVACGATLGPLSYWAGARLGAATFPHPGWSLAILATGWAVLLPLLLAILDRTQDQRPVSALEDADAHR